MSYSDFLSKVLKDIDAKEGCKLHVVRGDRTYTGILMPHHEFSAPDILILKLSSGYNVGVKVSSKTRIEVKERPSLVPKEEIPSQAVKGLPNVVLIGTGGTIASYVDYRTGAVHPALSTSELVNAVPELREMANISARVLFSIFSENMNVEHWQTLAEAVAEEAERGADAIIIPHGTDTMGYTAAALSFMLGGIEIPVVLVGAQRSSDRPSSDASSNLNAALKFCVKGKRPGVFVLMHDTIGDDSFAVHQGTRVRKMHTSRRDAFHSINSTPVANIDGDGKIEVLIEGRGVSDAECRIRTDMERAVIMLQYYPGMDPGIFKDVFAKSKGIVISGSGLGHVNENMVPLIKEVCDKGSVVVIVSQCLNGSTNLNVYNTGRDMISAGAISVSDMLPETAYVKLMWALANSSDVEEAKRIMKTPMANEMSDRRTIDV